jgi:hypothetical protein
MRKLLTILMLLLPLGAWATACPSGYTNEYFVTLNPSKSLTNYPFPVLFNGVTASGSLTLTDLKATGSGGKVQSSGNDIVFCDNTGTTLLTFGRGSWISTSGAAEFYISETTTAYVPIQVLMLVGKAADSDHSNSAGVCSAANYLSWYNLSDGTSLSGTDFCGLQNGTITTPTATAGVIDGGGSFNGTSDKITLGTTSYVATNAAFSVEAYVKLTNFSSTHYPGIITLKASNVSDPWTMIVSDDVAGPNGYLGFGAGGSTSWARIRDNVSFTTGANTYLAATYNGSGAGTNANFKLYKNGVSEALSQADPYGAITNASVIGNTGNFWKGLLDFVRIASDQKSADWIGFTNSVIAGNSSYVTVREIDIRTPSGLSSGAYCIPVVIDHTKVPNTDQTNYQLTIGGWYSWMRDVANGGLVNTAAGINNIVWYSNSTCTTVIPFETEAWSNTSGLFQGWAQVASASHTVDTTVYLGIGNPLNTSDQSNKTSLWGTQGVIDAYHFGSSTSLNTVGSGSAALDLSVGLSGTPQASNGLMGGGAVNINNSQFPATWLEWIPSGSDTIGAHGVPTGSAVSTLEVWERLYSSDTTIAGGHDMAPFGWGKTNQLGGLGGRLALIETNQADPRQFANIAGVNTGDWFNNSPGVGACTDTTGTICSFYGSGNTTPAAPVDLNWHHFVWVYGTAGGALSTAILYVDGVAVSNTFYGYPNGSASVPATGNGTGVSGAPAKVTVGDGAGHDCCRFVGQVDEARIWNVALTADRVATDYNNQSSPITFYSFGAAAPVTPSSVRHRVTYQ